MPSIFRLLLSVSLFLFSHASRYYSVKKEDGVLLKSPMMYNKIVGGHDADRTIYPWFALLKIVRQTTFGIGTTMSSCGGTLIAPDIVLTAAHCMAEPILEINVYVNGTSFSGTGTSYFRIGETVVTHPEYSRSLFRNDIAIIQLSSPVPDYVPPVAINRDVLAPVDGAALQVIGLGSLNDLNNQNNNNNNNNSDSTATDDIQFPEILQVVTVESINLQVCQEQNAVYLGLEIDPGSQLCAAAEGKDSCQGDSGGPLLMGDGESSFVQVGIVSYGVGCARPDTSGVYTRVSAHIDFLEEQICSLSAAPPAFCEAGTVPSPVLPPVTPSTAMPETSPTVFSQTSSETDAVSTTQNPTATLTNSPSLQPVYIPPEPSPSPSLQPVFLSSAPSKSPSLQPLITSSPTSLASIKPTELNEATSRSIVISKAGSVIATSAHRGPLEFEATPGHGFQIGLPTGLESMDGLSISKEGFLFGLSLYTPALCSFRMESEVVIPINCITGNWSIAPFTGMSADSGVIVISGGSGGMTMAWYNPSTGMIDPMLPCLNCTRSRTNSNSTTMCPAVTVTTQRTSGWKRKKEKRKTKPMAAIATIWDNREAGIILMDLTTFTEMNRFKLDAFMGSSLAVSVTNYPLVSAFYFVPRSKRQYLFTAHGSVVIHEIPSTSSNSNTIGDNGRKIELPVSDFEATCLAVDAMNGVLVVTGFLSNATTNPQDAAAINGSSMIAVYDLTSSPEYPILRVKSTIPGRILSVAANAGKVAYVTAESPHIVTYDVASSTSFPDTTPVPLSTTPPSATPSMAISTNVPIAHDPPQASSSPTLLPSVSSVGTAPGPGTPIYSARPNLPPSANPTPRSTPISATTTTTDASSGATGLTVCIDMTSINCWRIGTTILLIWISFSLFA